MYYVTSSIMYHVICNVSCDIIQEEWRYWLFQTSLMRMGAAILVVVLLHAPK